MESYHRKLPAASAAIQARTCSLTATRRGGKGLAEFCICQPLGNWNRRATSNFGLLIGRNGPWHLMQWCTLDGAGFMSSPSLPELLDFKLFGKTVVVSIKGLVPFLRQSTRSELSPREPSCFSLAPSDHRRHLGGRAGAFVGLSLGATNLYPGVQTNIKTMWVHITTIVFLRIVIIEIGSTVLLMGLEP